MKTHILKPIAAGILFGTLAWFMPFFILSTVAFFLTIGILFRIFGRRRFGEHWKERRMAWIENIRNMTAEEFEAFKVGQLSHGCGYPTRNQSYQTSNA